MFYEPHERDRTRLPHDPFKAFVAPRPIGWIGSRGRDGSVNLGPYSCFNFLADKPKLVMFSSTGRKDSLRNAEETGVFTASLVSRNLAEKMNRTSVNAPYGESEFAYAGLEMAEARLIDAPYVAGAYSVLECRVTEMFEPKDLDGRGSDNFVVIGQVVGIHLDEKVLRDGLLDLKIAGSVSRLGYMEYSSVAETFSMRRPAWGKD